MFIMIEEIERRLRSLLPPRDETLIEAARYSLLASGKRLRPLLCLATAGVFGIDPLQALDVACAIEMVHAYSLIHDDLPSMDNDDLRRGKPTLHKVYGEGMALLAGNLLLTLAFETITHSNKLHAEQKVQIIQTLSSRIGHYGMIGGQALDIESEGKEIDEEILTQMHFGKTASLILASLECGALVAKTPPSSPLQQIGKDLGLAYQLQDDLLDVTSTTQILGKTAQKDQTLQKSTAATLFSPAQIDCKLQLLKKSIEANLIKLPNQGSQLAILIKKILQRSY